MARGVTVPLYVDEWHDKTLGDIVRLIVTDGQLEELLDADEL